MNTPSDVTSTSFRPKMSLSFARMTRKPSRRLVAPCQVEREGTRVGNQVSCYDPATSIESLKVIGDGHQRRCDYGRLQRGQKYGQR